MNLRTGRSDNLHINVDEKNKSNEQLKKLDAEYSRVQFEYNSLSTILREEYSLYGEPPFEDAPIQEFVDYLMDGEENPRSEEIKADSRYQLYISLGKKIDQLHRDRAELLRQK